MVTVWWSAASLIHYSFWILVKPLHLRNMLSKSMRCTENCNACSWHWSTERTQFLTQCRTTHHTINCFKSWMNWALRFCFIRHIHLTSRQLTSASSSILTTFFRENASITSRRQKMLSKSSLNPKAWIFTPQEKTNLFLIGKNVLIEWFLFWLIKMCVSLFMMI